MGEFVARPKPQAPATAVRPKPVSHEAAPLQPTSPVAKQAKKRFKKLRLWWLDSWRPMIIGLCVILVVSTVLGFRMSTLTNGVSQAEQQYVTSVDSGQKLLKHPSFMPHKLPTYALFKLDVKTPAAYRATSAIIAVSAIVSGFFILRRWYSLRVAILGSWLVLTSAWLLHYARLARPEASFLLLLPLLWIAVWMYHTPKRRLAITGLICVSVMALYIPAFCWLVLGAIVWQRKTILQQLQQTEWWFRILGGLLALTLMTPLIIGVVLSPRELLLLIGLPASLPSIATLWQNFSNIPVQLLLRGPSDPTFWLPRLPLLDIFSAVMLLLGAYSLRYYIRLIRAQLILAITVIMGIGVVAGGLVTMIALLPIVYLLVAAGIAFMLTQWFTIFPRNPIARGLGTTLMSILVILVSFYHINHYFIAWPNAPATKDTFSTKTLVK